MPFGNEIRWWRRAPERFAVVIRQGKGTSSIGREPIEQEFFSAGTFRKPLSSPASVSPESRANPARAPANYVLRSSGSGA